MRALFRDVRFGLRSLCRQPGLSAAVVAMLALGIGINAATFAVVDAALFKGFRGVHQNGRLVRIGTNRDYIYAPDVAEWRRAPSFEDIALVRGVFHTLAEPGNAPDTAFTTEVTANTFRLLGVAPILGRDFTPEDAAPDAAPVLILRYDAWVRRFAADPRAIGRSIRVDGVATTIVGVMPDGFAFPAEQELWTPLVPTAAARRRDIGYARFAYGRLAASATLAGARAELETIGARLADAYPATNRGLTPVVSGFDDWFVGPRVRDLYWNLWGAVGCVLLLVSVNAGNLLVLRVLGRSHELAVRLALGANRWQLVRQTLIEGLVLATAGGVAGWWLATLGVRAVVAAQAGAGVLDVRIDRSVLAYVWGISAATGLIAALATVTYVTTVRARSAARGTSRTAAGGRGGVRLVEAFVALELALAVVLLGSAAVSIRHFAAVASAPVGVDTTHVLTASLYLPPERYPDDRRDTFYRDLGTRLAALPGVRSVAFGAVAPTDRTPFAAIELADAPEPPDRRPLAGTCVVSPGYFRTLGAAIETGRDVAATDRRDSEPVAVVNRRFADLYWHGQTAVGMRIRLSTGAPGAPAGAWRTVVGVVSNIVQNDRRRQTVEPLVYVPYAQQPQPNMFAFVRSVVPPATLVQTVRREVYALNPALPVPALSPLETRLARATLLERNTTALLAAFAVMALLLGATGVYAVVSHAVGRRRREIGVRMAVGATAGHVVRLVAGGGLRAAALGVPSGVVLAVAANRLWSAPLPSPSPPDLLAVGAGAALLALAVLVGCWRPARRAAQVDPAVVLKSE